MTLSVSSKDKNKKNRHAKTLKHIKKKIPSFTDPLSYAKQKNISKVTSDFTKRLSRLHKQRKYYMHPWKCTTVIKRTLVLQNFSTLYTYINPCSKTRVLDFLFPMSLSVFYNTEGTWYPFMEHLNTLKRILKLENDNNKKRFRIFIEEKDSNFICESAANYDKNISILRNWLNNIENEKANKFIELLDSHCNDLLAKSRNNGKHKEFLNENVENNKNLTIGSASIIDLGTEKTDFFPPDTVASRNNSNSIKETKKLSNFTKLWIENKPYIKTEAIYDLQKKTFQTSYVDINYKFCEVTKWSPNQLNDWGGVGLFKTTDIYKAHVEFFEKNGNTQPWNYDSIERPDVIYGNETKLFDLEENMVEGRVVVYDESVIKNNLLHIISTTLIVS